MWEVIGAHGSLQHDTNDFFFRIDGNLLKLYQQLVVYFLPMLTTPIFINTCVVFVRLYWFERRFENIGRRPSDTAFLLLD